MMRGATCPSSYHRHNHAASFAIEKIATVRCHGRKAGSYIGVQRQSPLGRSGAKQNSKVANVEIVASISSEKLLKEGLMFPIPVARLVFQFPRKKVAKSAYFNRKIAVN